MESRQTVLLVLFEGLADTVIDSAVLDHARQTSKLGIVFEIWAFCCSRTIYRRSRDRHLRSQEAAGANIRLFRGVRPGLPFSILINRMWLYALLMWWRPQFDVIHARTDYSAAVCAGVKSWHCVALIWDCRGDSVLEADERNRGLRLSAWLRRWARHRAERQRRTAGKACDAVIFVSEPLARLCADNMTGKYKSVIPCTASEDLFFFDPEIRRVQRSKLGYDDNDKVLIYCGSASTLEEFENSLKYFAEMVAMDGRWRLLILTPHLTQAALWLEILQLPQTTMVHARFEEVNRFLNAADAGLMLRTRNGVNRVACPTKFAEYCLTGLPIIMSDCIGDTRRIAQSLGLYVSAGEGLLAGLTSSERAVAAEKARTLVGRAQSVYHYRDIYRHAASARLPLQAEIPDMAG